MYSLSLLTVRNMKEDRTGGEKRKGDRIGRWVAGYPREERWRYVNAMNTNTNRGNQIFIKKNYLYLGYNRRFIEEEKIKVAAKRLFTVIFSVEERLRRFHKFYVFDTRNGR